MECLPGVCEFTGVFIPKQSVASLRHRERMYLILFPSYLFWGNVLELGCCCHILANDAEVITILCMRAEE